LRTHLRGTPVKLAQQAWIVSAARARAGQSARPDAAVSVFAKTILRRADETQVSRTSASLLRDVKPDWSIDF
jgi:hypothetical protein